ncbi:MAG TPA: hypothetical protein VMS71_00165 [Candidatus Acidoferrum sp.]|nr:hypothetical protein [Candidatus Acidoferrum sp.]
MNCRFRRLGIVLGGLLVFASLQFSCGGKSDNGADKSAGEKKFNAGKAQLDYQLLQAELKLAEKEQVYLELRFDLKQLRLMLKGAVVWSYPLDLSEQDSDDISDFVDMFRGSSGILARPLSETYLYAAQEKTPDSVLAIISEVTKFKPELLQRELPQRFQLHWGDNVILDIKTDVQGKPTSKFKNTMLEVRHVIQSTLGEAHLTVKMDATHALTLFRVAQPGLPTLIFPPSA